MPEKRCTHQRDYEEFFDQLVAEIVHCAVYQLTAIIGRDNLHALGQALSQRFKLVLDVNDGLPGVFATT